MKALYHYTCDHGRAGIERSGVLLPGAELTVQPVPWMSEFVWLTDLESPVCERLGLTSTIISCDRMRHRFRVTDGYNVVRWMRMRQHIPAEMRDAIESTPGALPAHWFVSTEPVPVVYDPIRAAVTA